MVEGLLLPLTNVRPEINGLMPFTTAMTTQNKKLYLQSFLRLGSFYYCNKALKYT
jgi:hypothetical protein